MCEVPYCKHMGYAEDENMRALTQEFATKFLYRIFIFEKGKSREHDLSIRAFQDFLHQKGISYSIRALYDYAEGRTPFPAVLVPYLIEFSQDHELLSFFLPSIKSALKKLNAQYETEEQELRGKMTQIQRSKEDLNL